MGNIFSVSHHVLCIRQSRICVNMFSSVCLSLDLRTRYLGSCGVAVASIIIMSIHIYTRYSYLLARTIARRKQFCIIAV